MDEEKEKMRLDEMRAARAKLESDREVIRCNMDGVIDEDFNLYVDGLREMIQGTFDRLIEELGMSEIPDEEYEALSDEFEERVFDKIGQEYK